MFDDAGIEIHRYVQKKGMSQTLQKVSYAHSSVQFHNIHSDQF